MNNSVTAFISNFQANEKEVKSLKPVYEQMISKLDEKLTQAEEGDEKEKLEHQVNDLTERWENVVEKVNNRQNVIEEFVPKVEDYSAKEQKFVTWLNDTENKLKNVPKIGQITISEYNQEVKVGHVYDLLVRDQKLYDSFGD